MFSLKQNQSGEFIRSGISCSDSVGRKNPEANVFDLVERWINFALSQINLLTVICEKRPDRTLHLSSK